MAAAYPHPDLPGCFVVKDSVALRAAMILNLAALRCALVNPPPAKPATQRALLSFTLLGKVWRRILDRLASPPDNGALPLPPPPGDCAGWMEAYRRVTSMMWKVLLEVGLDYGEIEDFIHTLLHKWLMRPGPDTACLPMAYLETATIREGLRVVERRAKRAAREQAPEEDTQLEEPPCKARKARKAGRPRQEPMPGKEPESRALTPLGEAVRREVKVTVLSAVANLPERERAMVACCYLEGRTGTEAAALFGVKPGTVSATVARGLRRLRESLPGDGESCRAIVVRENPGNPR